MALRYGEPSLQWGVSIVRQSGHNLKAQRRVTHKCIAVDVLTPLLLSRLGIINRQILLSKHLNRQDRLVLVLNISSALPSFWARLTYSTL
jgi:hypothetical protein